MLKFGIILLLSCTTVFSQTIFEFAKKGDITTSETLGDLKPSDYNQQNDNGYSPLMLAAYYNRVEMVSYLLSKKANINDVGPYGSALMAASVKGYKDVVALLLTKGADVNISDDNGTTALHYAALFGYTAMAKLLVNNNANINAKDFRGNKALDYAILKQNEDLIRILNK